MQNLFSKGFINRAIRELGTKRLEEVVDVILSFFEPKALNLPTPRTKEEILDGVLKNPALDSVVADLSKKTQLEEGVVRAKVIGYLGELATSNFDADRYGRLYTPVKFVFDKCYKEVVVDEAKLLCADNVVRLDLFNHLSLIEFILWPWIVVDKGAKPVYIYAGDNILSDAFQGILKGWGAVTVPREPPQDRNERLIFGHSLNLYCLGLIDSGIDALLFPGVDKEGNGGRSKTGELYKASPRVLNAYVRAQQASPDKDVVLQCGAFSYDRVMEDAFIVSNNHRRRGSSTTFKDLVFMLMSKMVPFSNGGKVYIRLAEQIHLREYLNGSRDGSLNEKVTEAIGNCVLVTPSSAVAYVMMNQEEVAKSGVMDGLDRLLHPLEQFLTKDAKNRPSEVLDYAMRYIEGRAISEKAGTFVNINPALTTYYGNQIAHLVPK